MSAPKVMESDSERSGSRPSRWRRAFSSSSASRRRASCSVARVESGRPSIPLPTTTCCRWRPLPSIHWMTVRPFFLVMTEPMAVSYRRLAVRDMSSPRANARTASG